MNPSAARCSRSPRSQNCPLEADTYEEEMNNSDEEGKEQVDFTISDDGSAYLSSHDGEYEWTWEVIEA